MHHPPSNANGTLYNGTAYTAITDTADGSLLNNRTMLLNICDSNHVDIVLAGHVHQNVVCNRKGAVVADNWSLGTRYVQTDGEFNGSYRIITVDSNFVYVGTPQIASVTTLVENLTSSSSTTVSPNPFTNYTEITTSSTFNNATLYLLDITGREVAKYENLNGNRITMHRDGLQNGIYFFRMFEQSKQLSCGKIIIQ